MEIYLLKSSIALTILYSFYWLLLRKETHFSINRIYLLLAVLVSFIAPLFQFTSFSASAQIQNILEPVIISSQKQLNLSDENNFLSILSIVYISGVVFFTLKFLSNLSKIWFLYSRFPKVRLNGFRAVLVNVNVSPFTFFSVLFLSRSDYEGNNIAELIAHEKTHKEQFHSLDVLLTEFATIVQWFNPFVWLIRMAIQAEHEFIADSKVLEKGYDKVAYQNLLFEKSLGVIGLGVTSNFNYSLLKTRLKMMAMKKSGRSAIAKYLIALPLMLTICFFLSFGSKTFAQEKIYETAEVMPTYPGGDNALKDFIAQNLKYPDIAAEQGIQAKIFVMFVVSSKGDVNDVKIGKIVLRETDKEGKTTEKDYKLTGNEKIDAAVKALEEESIRVVKKLGAFTPGKNGGTNISVQYTFPIMFILQ